MESISEFLKRIDFDQDAIFHTIDDKLHTSTWDRNGLFGIVGIFNDKLPVEKFTLTPKMLSDMLTFTDLESITISEDKNLLKIQSLEVDGTINLHEEVGREGAPKIEYSDENTFLIKNDMIAKILRARKMYDSKLLQFKTEDDMIKIRVKGATEEAGLDFKIHNKLSDKINLTVGSIIYDILEKSSGYDVHVWLLDDKPVRLGISSSSFSILYYVMNQ